MFNKKLFVFLVLILFILQISFVNAQNDNTTKIINKTEDEFDHPKLSINNNSQNIDNISEIKDFYNEKELEFNQGDKMPIHINTPSEGILKVLIDNKEYGLWNFTNNDTIYIPTYNPESFFNETIMNIGIGSHDISLIFNFKYGNYNMNMSFDMNSTLNFNFYQHFSNDLANSEVRYSSKLNIIKKEKTIHIVKFTFHNLCEYGTYKIHVDNKNDEDAYGVIISNESGIIYKKDYYYCSDYETYWGLYEINEVGIYKFFVVNFADGTTDTIFFKVSKYQPKLNITYNLNKTNMTIHIFNPLRDYVAIVFVTLDNATKEVYMFKNCGSKYEVSFENLTSGIHVMSVYCDEDYNSYSFFYSITFEIDDSYINPNEDNNIIANQTTLDINNTSNTTSNTSNINSKNGNIHKDIKNSNSHSTKNNGNSINKLITSEFGNIKFSDSNYDSPTLKSYEISEKAVIKSSDNILTQLGLIVIFCIFLMVGYFEFRQKQ